MNWRRIGLVVVAVIIIAAAVLYATRQELFARLFTPTSTNIEQVKTPPEDVTVVAEDLTTPWSIRFLPDGDMLISQRQGELRRIGDRGAIYEIEGVRETSEGGLLGIALHPEFSDNQRLYLYYTTEGAEGLMNQIVSAELVGNRLNRQQVIIDGIPAAANHNGGAIEFGPDGKLYVTTGDAAEENLAQDRQSLAGKILRLNDDGSVPDDNPFGNPVWSYGHRNPQGIAWDVKGQLWSVEHGPSGGESGRDELNLIEKGANYGWPEITGDEQRSGMRSPILQSGDSDTWAPARMAYIDGKLLFTGLRGQAVYAVSIGDDQPTIKQYFSGDYGRLRAIAVRGDALYVGTSNRDGRGSASFGSDKILEIRLAALNDGDN